MALRVLGPIEIDDGKQLSPRERTVLAALVVAGPHGSSAAALADALWGDAPPGTWQKQLQAVVGHIRRAVGADAVETIAKGYALRAEPGWVDADQFGRLVEAARRHTAADQPERAVESYRRAVGLWRGEAFAELAEWEPAAAEISRLREMLHTAQEELLDARLACGEHSAVIADAERLVHESPYREERWRLLAVANYQSDRQAEALAALRRARRILRDDLGIEPGARLVTLESAILRHDPSLSPVRHTAPLSTECPYRGLDAYGPQDADAFFGRGPEIEAVADRLTRRRFLALTGASGSGKSSLALAGVVPLLRRRGWDVVVARPSPDETAPSLPSGEGEHHVVVIDQFEELFGLGLGGVELDRRGESLESIVRSGACLLLTVRSDYLDRCAAVPSLARLVAAGVHVVGPMSRDGLRLAIEGPATRAGLRLEPGLAELVLRDAQGATAPLPLLSHSLVETWLRREGSVLTVAGYEASGGIRGAVAQSADALYATLTPDEQAVCRSTMLRLVSRGPDGTAVRRRVASGPLIEDRERRDVLARLTRARLITAQDDSIVVAHEAIASAWPRLESWLEEDREAVRMTEQLTTATALWAEAGMPDSDLYRGARLAAVEEWVEASHPRLTSEEASFVAASTRAAQAERQAAEARAALDRRNNRRLSVALASVAVLLVASLGASGIAISRGVAATRSADAAEAARTDASIEALMSTSLALRDSQRDVSALLAAEMWRRWPDDPRSRAALMGVVTASGGLVSTRYVDADTVAGILVPHSDEVLLVTDRSRLQLRDVRTGAVTASAPTPVEGFTIDDMVAVSADGARAAMVVHRGAGDDLAVRVVIVSTTDLTLVGEPFDVRAALDAIAVDSTGSTVAVAYDAGAAVSVVDVVTGATRETSVLPEVGEAPELGVRASVAFAPDGRIALGAVRPAVLLLDPGTLDVDASVPVPPRSAHQASAMTSDGVLVASGERSTIAIDTRTDQLLWSHTLETTKPTACARLAASAAAGALYCADDWGGAVEYDLATGAPTGRHFDPGLGSTRSIGLTSDGTELLAVGAGTPSLSLWRTDGSGAAMSLQARGKVMLDGYGGPDQALVVAARPPDARYDVDLTDVSLWSPDGDRTLLDLEGELQGAGWAGPDLIAAFSPTDDAFVTIVASTGERIETGLQPEASIRLWLSPSGTRLYMSNYTAPDGATTGHGWIDMYAAESGERLPLTFELGEGYPWGVAADGDDSLVAVTRWIDGVPTTGVYDGRTGDVVVDGLEGPTVTAITPSGELLAAQDGRITRHDLRTLARTGALPGAHGEVNSLQVSRDGLTLLATSNDETVTLYDLPSGIRLGDPIPASAPLIGQGALRPDGLELVVNVADGIQVWDADPGHQFAAACRIAGRELSAEERATYLRSLPALPGTCAAVLGEAGRGHTARIPLRESPGEP